MVEASGNGFGLRYQLGTLRGQVLAITMTGDEKCETRTLGVEETREFEELDNQCYNPRLAGNSGGTRHANGQS